MRQLGGMLIAASLAASPAPAVAETPASNRVAALIASCPLVGEGYFISPAATDREASEAEVRWLDEWTERQRGDLVPPDTDGATIRLRGAIGSSITQSIPFSTGTTLWRDADGQWQVWRVDKGNIPPPPPPPPSPEALAGADLSEGLMIEEVRKPPDNSRRVQRGRLNPAPSKELDRLIADPCFQLEMMGLAATANDGGMPLCPYDYAGSTIEVRTGGRVRLVTTDCARKLPSARISDILFYPDADPPMPEWNARACSDCDRYVPVTEIFRRAEKTGDPATDAIVARVYAAVAKKDLKRARALLEPIAGEKSTFPGRWLLLPELAWLRYKTDDLEGAIAAWAVASAVRRAQEGKLNCEPQNDISDYQKALRWAYGTEQVCRQAIVTEIAETVDPASIELARTKIGLMDTTLYAAEARRLREAGK